MDTNKTKLLQAILILIIIQVITNWYFDFSYLKYFFLNPSMADWEFGILQNFLFLFVLPYATYLLYQKKSAGYVLLLYYFSFTPSSTLFAYLKYPWRFPYNSITPFLFIIIRIITLILLVPLKFFSKSSKWLAIITGVLASTLTLTIYMPFILVFVSLPLLIIIIVWDVKLFLKNKLGLEDKKALSNLFKTKLKMCLIPFLISIPLYFIIPFSSSLTVELYFITPAVVAFIWFQLALAKKTNLSLITQNYYWTMFMLYCLLFGSLAIYSLAASFSSMHF
ncbi:hypothetical protein [Ferruginibacter albus]|uniref:hypothetical protein n=1 Tax=Ferruginibacter albus TaxID=2875540 RepID=UPI001CC4BE25|nr:hypothetical protein [Ferruginibacter albus]UAY51101.1 hypothetical protein K9M53_10920 [Ferruginibacter albus]